MDYTKTWKDVADFYEQRIDTDNVFSWESREAQEKRFKVLTDNIKLKGKSLLDFGCGFGDLIDFLKKNNVTTNYTGYDISEMLIEKAKIKHPEIPFISGEFHPEKFKEKSYDTVYASGIFNLNTGNNLELFKECILKMAKIPRETLIFNLLSNTSMHQEDKYNYFDKNEIMGYLKQYFKEIKIIDDYLKNDFTVLVSIHC